MEQFQKEKEELDKGCRECKRKLAECQKKMKELEVSAPESGKGELEKLQAEAQQLRKEEKSWEKKLEELKKKEKNLPWNVDTLSKDGFSKVGIGNDPPLGTPPPLSMSCILTSFPFPERFQCQSRGAGGNGGAEGEEAQKLCGEAREADQTLW